jgi:hypothetical protein
MELLTFIVVLVIGATLGMIILSLVLANGRNEGDCRECQRLKTELYRAEMGRDKLCKIIMSQQGRNYKA